MARMTTFGDSLFTREIYIYISLVNKGPCTSGQTCHQMFLNGQYSVEIYQNSTFRGSFERPRCQLFKSGVFFRFWILIRKLFCSKWNLRCSFLEEKARKLSWSWRIVNFLKRIMTLLEQFDIYNFQNGCINIWNVQIRVIFKIKL